MNIKILPPEGNIEYLGHLIAFKDAVQVEFALRIKCAWATFTSHSQQLPSPKDPLKDRLKSSSTRQWNDHSSTCVDDDGRDEEQTSDFAMTDDEDDHATRRERRSRRRRTSRPRQRAGGRQRLNPVPKTPTSKKEAATTQTGTLLSTKYHATNQKTNWNRGSTTQCEQRTRQTTCRQQMEGRRGSSD